MRMTGKYTTHVVVLMALAACLALPASAQDDVAAITITRLAGTVEVFHQVETSNAWSEAAVGQLLSAGWRLRTAADSKVQLLFPRDNVVILKENSVLYVDGLDSGGGANLAADEGSLLVDLKNALSPGSEFELNTPTALAVVRGTKFGAADIDEDDAFFYGYRGEVELFNDWGMVLLEADFTVDAVAGMALSEPYPSGPEADEFVEDAEDTSAFEDVEEQGGDYLAALTRLEGEVDGLASTLDGYGEEWRRYERQDQVGQMLFLYAQVLALGEQVDEAAAEFAGLRAAIEDAGPDVAGAAGVAEALARIEAKLAALYERLAEFADDAEPLIVDSEDLLESLRGLIEPGNPALGLRWKLIDTDGDGVSDVDEWLLGLDPLAPNDDGFIELLEPDDGEEVDYPEQETVVFEYEPLDSDLVQNYNLVLEAGGRQWLRGGIAEQEELDLTMLVGPRGEFADEVDEDGLLSLEWFVVAEVEEDQLFQQIALQNPAIGAALGASISSERRQLLIQLPTQADVVVVDLEAVGPTAVGVDELVRIQGRVSEVTQLGEWEIRVACDPSVLEFDGGRRLGLLAGSTVFFGDEPGGIVVISGAIPRGGDGITGEGEVFELTFLAVDEGLTTVEVEDVALRDVLDSEIEAEPGEEVEVRVAAAGQGPGAFSSLGAPDDWDD